MCDQKDPRSVCPNKSGSTVLLDFVSHLDCIPSGGHLIHPSSVSRVTYIIHRMIWCAKINRCASYWLHRNMEERQNILLLLFLSALVVA